MWNEFGSYAIGFGGITSGNGHVLAGGKFEDSVNFG